MTAAALLTRCRALGIALAADPDGSLAWEWEADADPPRELLAELARHKAGVLALLAAPAPSSPPVLAGEAWLVDAIAANLELPPGSVFIDRGTTTMAATSGHAGKPAGTIFALLPGGDVVECDARQLPPEAAYWCRASDREWKPVTVEDRPP